MTRAPYTIAEGGSTDQVSSEAIELGPLEIVDPGGSRIPSEFSDVSDDDSEGGVRLE